MYYKLTFFNALFSVQCDVFCQFDFTFCFGVLKYAYSTGCHCSSLLYAFSGIRPSFFFLSLYTLEIFLLGPFLFSADYFCIFPVYFMGTGCRMYG